MVDEGDGVEGDFELTIGEMPQHLPHNHIGQPVMIPAARVHREDEVQLPLELRNQLRDASFPASPAGGVCDDAKFSLHHAIDAVQPATKQAQPHLWRHGSVLQCGRDVEVHAMRICDVCIESAVKLPTRGGLPTSAA